MTSYKEPSFQERVAHATKAKEKALKQLRSRPPLDDKVVAERKAASLKRETAKAQKTAAKQATERAAAEAKAAEASAEAAAPSPPTEAERKAARDARYAARKNRK
jgi:hypothetical protein